MTLKEFRHQIGRLFRIRKYLILTEPREFLDIGKLLNTSSDSSCAPRLIETAEDFKNDKRPIVTMSQFGYNGRFGNQLFQYAFLSLVAHRQSAQLQLPVWAGSAIFGLRSMSSIKTNLKTTRESKMTVEGLINLMTNKDNNFKGIDYDGYAQLHTSCYVAHQEFIRSLFVFDTRLTDFFNQALARLGLVQKKIISIHLRRGDYGYNHYFRAPCSWYEKWINAADYSPNEYIIYICSESPEVYRQRFPQFTVITSDDLKCPAKLAPYFDFMVMTRAEVVATSNSSFSFFASMLNTRAKHFFRPDFDQLGLVQYNPWNADPLLTRELSSEQHEYLRSID
jgi:Glycosyl transferase family 11